jgi:hypothetical protein
MAKEGPRSISHFLARLAHGQAQVDLSADLQEVTSKTQDIARRASTKARGKMVIALEFDITPDGEMTATYSSKITTNKPKRAGSHAWVTKGGNVVFEDPRQGELALHDVKSKHDDEDPVDVDDDEDDAAAGAGA